jgi:hypothetical protein
MRAVMMALGLVVALSGAAAAKPSLRDVPEIDNGLFAVGLANKIRKTCADISPRYFRAISFLRDLESKAYAMGYTEDEVEAHLESDAEKNRQRARAADYMKARGFEQTETGYCALGRSEIERKTRIGTFLRVND